MLIRLKGPTKQQIYFSREALVFFYRTVHRVTKLRVLLHAVKFIKK